MNFKYQKICFTFLKGNRLHPIRRKEFGYDYENGKDVVINASLQFLPFVEFNEKYALKICLNCDPFWTFLKPLWYCMSWLFCSTMTSASALVGGR